jgi:hypothetical protein
MSPEEVESLMNSCSTSSLIEKLFMRDSTSSGLISEDARFDMLATASLEPAE